VMSIWVLSSIYFAIICISRSFKDWDL
jgi:hypothetical protein